MNDDDRKLNLKRLTVNDHFKCTALSIGKIRLITLFMGLLLSLTEKNDKCHFKLESPLIN